MIDLKNERDRLLDMYAVAEGEERARILARLVVLDEEDEANDKKRNMAKSHRNSKRRIAAG